MSMGRYIKALHIRGFKKFESLDVNFNEKINILVGENEAGKSTILDAIKVVINQQYRNADKSILADLFNQNRVNEYIENPDIKSLPSIYIELELELDRVQKNDSYFYGEEYGERKSGNEKFGICFECKYDEDFVDEIEEYIEERKIPYEYYKLTWTTFANRTYQIFKKPLNIIAVNTAGSSSYNAFNYYNKALFSSVYDEKTRVRAKNRFRTKISDALNETELRPISENRRFGIDSKKVVLENVLSVYENEISLENRGSGTENLIKTQIALDKKNSVDVVLMEEPENHLSFLNLHKMLEEIVKQKSNSQLIITTHNNMIASRLNLNNVLWITDERVKSLADVDKDTGEFFVKANNNSLLQLLLSKKVFLVEGTTEFLLVPKFYFQITNRTIEEDGISVISCNGISYARYLKIAEKANKKIAVITDNDKKECVIQKAEQFNSEHNDQHIYTGKCVDDWTWEVCLYNENKDILNESLPFKKRARYPYKGKIYDPALGYMLNNKVDTAYEILTKNIKLEIPKYINEAIEWLSM